MHNQNALNVAAAALSLPGISLQIAKLALTYELQQINVNAYMNTFLRALADYISGYEQSNSIINATIDHITSGQSQLENLIAQMNQILSISSGSTTDISFRVKLSSYGTVWGVELAAIIAWFQANPGAGAALLSQTTASVEAYKKAVALITAYGNQSFPGGTVYISSGEEDGVRGFVTPLTQLLVSANTIVATSQSKTSILAKTNTMRSYLLASKKADNQIIAYLQPFLNTKTTLSGPVLALVNQLIAFSNKMGLDRIAGLLTNGNVADLFSATPDTSTYAGAAVTGINSILAGMQQVPTVTTQQMSQIESLRDQVKREQKAQEVYAGRGAAKTQGQDIAQQQAKVDSDKQLVASATEAARQLDSTIGTDPGTLSKEMLSPQVTPGGLPDRI
jgi:hypothetical protein